MILLLAVILVALIFEYINGFHDTANSIAIRTVKDLLGHVAVSTTQIYAGELLWSALLPSGRFCPKGGDGFIRRRRPSYPLAGCSPAEPASVSLESTKLKAARQRVNFRRLTGNSPTPFPFVQRMPICQKPRRFFPLRQQGMSDTTGFPLPPHW